MKNAVPLDTCTITLGNVAASDAFGLSLVLDGEEIIETVAAVIPAEFRSNRRKNNAPFAEMGQFKQAGCIIGFLQNNVLLMPIRMPCDGWLLASIADGSRVEHATPVFRFLRATGSITQ
jgi:hypothetical protein